MTTMRDALDLRPVVPALIVGATGLVVLLAQAFTPRGRRAPAAGLSFLGLVAALVAVLLIAAEDAQAVLAGSVAADSYALFFQVLILSVGLLVVLFSPQYLAATKLGRGEYYSLVLFSIVGMMGLVSCLDLISIFVALEIMSVALYALAGMQRAHEESQEAAVKYFLTGAFSSAFLLYGIAVLYGTAGSTSLASIAAALRATPKDALAFPLLGAGLLLVGFGFKVASVPFHMWTPDVYEGAPTSITGFMAAGVKAAAFGALLRVFSVGLGWRPFAGRWHAAVAVLAILTMIVGNLGALAQTNLKRMLAYSSIAHAGYLLTALVAAPAVAAEAVLFYLVGYAAVNLGAFGALGALARDGREPLGLDDVAGLAERRPALAAVLTVFLISLTGIPVSAGFVGKFYLFSAAVRSDQTVLAIVGVLMSVVSAYYYLRVVVVMYMRDPVGEDPWAPVGAGPRLGLAIAAFVVLLFGIYPAPLLAWAQAAAASLR
jgi:NADH-quinone oxidoreductase subunit N